MICSDTDEKYRKLWGDFNHQILEEPLIFPKRFAKPSIEHGEYELNQLYQALNKKKANEKEWQETSYQTGIEMP